MRKDNNIGEGSPRQGPSSQIPPQSYGPQGFGPQGYGPQGLGPQGYPAGYLGQGYPPPQPAGYPKPPEYQAPYANMAAPYQPPQGSHVMNLGDPGLEQAAAFAEKAVRNGFIRKVFGIVMIQLAVTVGFACVCLYVDQVRSYIHQNRWVYITSWVVSFVLVMMISCVESIRRKYPVNLMLLGLFTIAMAVLVGTITAYHDISVVMLAFLTTCIAVGALTLFAMTTKIDVTKWSTFLLIGMILFIFLLLVGIFWINRIFYLVIAGVGALLFSIYLVHDIQLMMGQKHYSISPDEHILGALMIYLDIINLFLMILTIFGLAQRS